MEKRGLISLRGVLLRYLVQTVFCCVLALLLWFAGLMCVINSGLELPANQAAQACQKAAQDVLPGMTAETFDDLALHQIVETEPACDGKHNSQNGYDSQQGTVCQRGRLVHKPVFGEAVDARPLFLNSQLLIFNLKKQSVCKPGSVLLFRKRSFSEFFIPHSSFFIQEVSVIYLSRMLPYRL